MKADSVPVRSDKGPENKNKLADYGSATLNSHKPKSMITANAGYSLRGTIENL